MRKCLCIGVTKLMWWDVINVWKIVRRWCLSVCLIRNHHFFFSWELWMSVIKRWHVNKWFFHILKLFLLNTPSYNIRIITHHTHLNYYSWIPVLCLNILISFLLNCNNVYYKCVLRTMFLVCFAVLCCSLSLFSPFPLLIKTEFSN